MLNPDDYTEPGGGDGDPQAQEAAKKFVALLPPDITRPDWGVDPDGEIALDWRRNGDALSLSVGPRNVIYACYRETRGAYSGAFGFDGSAIPPRLLEMIREVAKKENA